MRRRVLLVFANPYSRVRRHLPYGLMLLAAALREHEVRIVSPYQEHDDPDAAMAALVADYRPDIIGVGVRNIDTQVTTEWGRGNYVPPDGSFETTWFVPTIASLIAAMRNALDGRSVPIVLGGGGFQAAPRALLRHFDLRYGVVGPGAETFRRLVDGLPEVAEALPGMLVRHPGPVDRFTATPPVRYLDAFSETLEPADIPAQLADNLRFVPIGMRTRAGCDKACNYCLDPVIEGKRVRYRDPDDVVAQLERWATVPAITRVFFTDPELNIPDDAYTIQLCERIIAAGLHERFRFSSQFQPFPMSKPFAQILARAGFSDLCISVDSLDRDVLRKNGKHYTIDDVRDGIVHCIAAQIPILVDFILGMVGETDANIDRTLDFLADHDLPGAVVKLNIMLGLRVYERTPLAKLLAKHRPKVAPNVYGLETPEFLEPCYVCYGGTPRALAARVSDALAGQANVHTGVVYRGP